MKKTYILLLTALLGLSTSGCNEMLNPQPVGTQTVDNTFTDFAGTISAVNGIYNILSGGNLYRGDNNLLYIDYASDDVMAGDSKVSSSAYSLVDYFELPADNAQTFGLWDGLYRIIYRSNVVIGRVPALNFPVAQSRNSAGLLFKDQFIGEAKFLRAFAYFNLVRLFGDVPLRTDEIKSASEVNIPRAPSAQVYAQIIDDLKDAATKLPPTVSGSGVGNERGRPTRWAALTMLADVYLTQRNWAEARNTAAQVLTQSGLNLNARYADSFAARGGSENSGESLFEVQFSNNGQAAGTAGLGNNYSFIMGAVNEVNGGVVSLAAYRPTDNASADNEAGFRGGLIQEYEEGDLRRDVTFVRGLGSGGFQRWLTIKHHLPNTGAVGQVNFPIYRLAETLLIYAEAANESGVLDAQGLEYLNRLRRRAFGLPLTTPSTARDIASGLTQAQYRDIIRSERRKELAMENKRWFDLVRYGFDYANTVLKVNQKREGFSRERMLFPIARIETINNPLLTQNPGY
ncbi:RagB/SusD family nutrient uptake outer membrane protein [Rudanella paleaurantiibacter]|uniref:RagB/SusD family nutrient uptake outer membrane protein n=1 Tax=Rudanella paleaurantiibacter TaxID=2614655 RepID=A0A7J5TT31_9BACT|nr:RagB/SusD family nutrient uptake outer membrane protein [Rudanella paleaurantiibacter]KAB7726866.1 RagB/SusD family nutrient uptake outer membrane protein [Rudanella paleaurantiibacter]